MCPGLLKKAAHNGNEEHAFHDVHDMLMMMHDGGHSSEGHFMQTACKLLHGDSAALCFSSVFNCI